MSKLRNFTNSVLAVLRRISPHSNNPRNQPIRRITIHHTAGNIGLEALGDWLARATTRASYNYGIASDGRVGVFVEEQNRSWASSSPANDHQAVTIGVANNTGSPYWGISDKAFDSLIKLCVDICQRNGIEKLIFDGTPNGTLSLHNMFSATTCPGHTLQKAMQEICCLVNAQLGHSTQAIEEDRAKYPISEETLQDMVDLGVMRSPYFWREINFVKWLPELLVNASADGKLDPRIENGILDVGTAINVLQDAGIITSPDYWKGVLRNYDVKYLDQLLINLANRSRNVLERIVWAEAEGEDLKGQVLVGVVVAINRVLHRNFPNGIRPVVFQVGKNSAGERQYQFSPVADGRYAKAVITDSVRKAVDQVLDGVDLSQGATHFHRNDGRTRQWIETAIARGTMVRLFTHGNHVFYKEL